MPTFLKKMGDLVLSASEPSLWFIGFHRTTPSRLARLLARGKFKHVSAFCRVGDRWLVYDVCLDRTRLMWCSAAEVARFTRDAEIIEMPPGRGGGVLMRFGFWCVPAVKHLLGLRCVAVTPTGLFRWCLRNGGIPLGQQRQPSAICSAERSIAD